MAYRYPLYDEEEKPVRRGDERRKQAKWYSKMPLDQPTMWNHRMFNVNSSWELWKYQVPKNKWNFLGKSDMYLFIFGDDKENSIDYFLTTTVFGKILDGFEHYFVDNIGLNYHGYSNQVKNYTITFYSEVLGDRHPVTLYEKVIVAKLIILIMNECDPEDLNYTNYGNLVHWFNENAKRVKFEDKSMEKVRLQNLYGFEPVSFDYEKK